MDDQSYNCPEKGEGEEERGAKEKGGEKCDTEKEREDCVQTDAMSDY
jgi:hypothetical protein